MFLIYWSITWKGKGEQKRWNPTFTGHFLRTYAISFNSHDNPAREISLHLFHREGNRGSEMSRDLPKATQLVSVWAEIWVQVSDAHLCAGASVTTKF